MIKKLISSMLVLSFVGGFDSFETDDELMAKAQVEYEKRTKEGKEKKPKEPVTINGKPQR